MRASAVSPWSSSHQTACDVGGWAFSCGHSGLSFAAREAWTIWALSDTTGDVGDVWVAVGRAVTDTCELAGCAADPPQLAVTATTSIVTTVPRIVTPGHPSLGTASTVTCGSGAVNHGAADRSGVLVGALRLDDGVRRPGED